MKAYKCERCNNSLYSAEDLGGLDIEIQCPKCQYVNYPHRFDEKSIVLGPKGKDFMSKSIDHVCIGCKYHTLLFRSIGSGYIEMRCKLCHTSNFYNSDLMRKGKWKIKK